jgi:arylsulfatase A-like enzyme
MLAAVDEAVGQIEASLAKAGLLENTLIVFSSDNGGPPPGDNHPLRGYKGSLLEGGLRAAAFATWPGHIPAGQRLRAPMHIIDWYPTLLKLAGASLEQPLPVDGLDVWPMLTQSAPTPHDAILSVSIHGPKSAALRMGDWKLIRGESTKSEDSAEKSKREKKKSDSSTQANSPSIALYDLASDPSESRDVAAAHPDRVQALRSRLDSLLSDAVSLPQPAR